MQNNDKRHLRGLAEKYSEYANNDIMSSRREKWRLHNKLEEKTFPFHIEDNGSFIHDLMQKMQCEDNDAKDLEYRLLNAICYYENINDDRIIPERFLVDWVIHSTQICDELKITHSNDSDGGNLGFETNKPIEDIDGDFHKLKHRVLTLDKEKSYKRRALAEDAFKGLMPVELGRASSFYSDGIANKAVLLVGMQQLFLDMMANPEAIHRLFSFLAEDNLALGKWEEDNGVLTYNSDGNQGYCSGSCLYSDETAGPEFNQKSNRLTNDRYGYLEAQEATGVSPDMFGEFFMPHFIKLAKKFKLIKFGCCEAVHDLMPHLNKLNGLRKVSVTPWCNLEKQAQDCDKNIIWSRKPVPLKLCGTQFNPDELKEHLQETLDIGKDFFIEFVFRDTTSLTGEMKDRVDVTCNIVRELTQSEKGSKQ